jgi:hypothetical protein
VGKAVNFHIRKFGGVQEIAMILKIPLVSESDYPALKSVCTEEVVGSDYKDYLVRVMNRRASLREIGMEAELVKISVQPLLTHYDEHHKADWTDLMHYMRLNAQERRRPGRRRADHIPR